MIKLKKVSKILFLSTFIFFLLINSLCAEISLVIDALESKGAWVKGIVTNRRVIFADRPFVASEIQISVPKSGKYQLFAYVHHNWRKYFPCIYVEAVDSQGRGHNGYHKIENIWYLDQEDKGRWFLISLVKNPFWELPEGKLYVRFWVTGNSSAWDNAAVPMEDRVCIESFFLIPVVGLNSDFFSPGIINLESGKGNWNISDYNSDYATNLISAEKEARQIKYPVKILTSGYYKGWISALSVSSALLKLKIKNRYASKEIVIKLNGNNEWFPVPTDSIFLKKGEYILSFENIGSSKIMLDYFILLPADKIG